MATGNTGSDDRDNTLYVMSNKENTSESCGFRRDYLSQNLSEMEEELVICKKCSGIMRQASICKGETTCLACSESPDELNSVKSVQNSILKLEIKCPLLRECKWNGILSEAEEHLKDCLFFLIQCDLCRQSIPRGEMEEHGAKICQMRVVPCQYCAKEERVGDLDKHFETCSEHLIACPKHCGSNLPRGELSQHKLECVFEEIACPYTEYGCRANPMLRRDLLAHKKEFYIEHQDMSFVEISGLKTQIEQQETDLHLQRDRILELEWMAKTTKQLDGVEWKIQNVDNIPNQEVIKGPVFYINNYKLRIYLRYSFFDTCFTHSINYPFSLKRLDGEFDKHLGDNSCITQYKIITVNRHDYTKSLCEEGTMNYQLKVGSKSTNMNYHFSHNKKHHCLTSDDTLTLRFYFVINTSLTPPLVGVKHELWKRHSSQPRIRYFSDSMSKV